MRSMFCPKNRSSSGTEARSLKSFRFFDADTWARLRQVKALYDPSDLFQGNHHIPPAELS